MEIRKIEKKDFKQVKKYTMRHSQNVNKSLSADSSLLGKKA